MHPLTTRLQLLCALLCAGLALPSAFAADGYYTEPTIFQPHPVAGKTWSIDHWGPVGLGIDLVDPAFTMKIKRVDAGSPAAATGELKPGQIIQSINGQVLRDIDPRVILGNWITEAEATDGKLRLMVKDSPQAAAREVVVTLPVLGSYSDTWPLDCEKSDRIVRNLAAVLAQQEQPNWGSMLFLLSTGEDADMAVVRHWVHSPAFGKGWPEYPWDAGMRGPALCEYYLRTGDEAVLPQIERMVSYLEKLYYNGGWSGRGHAAFKYMGGGHLNAAGVHCVTFLLLARQCGVEVDAYTLQSALRHFYRFAGHGNVAYGDQLPEGGFRDNGKTAGLAMAMSAAAMLTPDGEASIYAQARDNSAMKSFYATNWFSSGHTGGGIGEIWHNTGMSLVSEKRPVQYRSFINERRWSYELSRRFDGTMGITGGPDKSYDQTATSGRGWGTYYALIYTLPRKKLRLFGAPATQWSQTHPLPERPWGNAADDRFQSNEPAAFPDGRVQDISAEVVPTDASLPILQRLSDPAVTDEALVTYAHHPEYGLRVAVSRCLVAHKRDHLILPLMRSDDPRVREVGVLTVAGMFKGRALPDDRVTDAMIDRLIAMVEDPDESWWVTRQALDALSRAKPEQLAPHIDRIAVFLDHDDWWLRSPAVTALQGLAADPRYYQALLPKMGDIVASDQSFQGSEPVGGIAGAVQDAPAEVQALALQQFRDAYLAIPDPIVAHGGKVTNGQTEILKSRAAGFLAAVPGGQELLMSLPKLNAKWQATQRDEDKYVYDGTFTKNDALLGTWKVVDTVKTIADFTATKPRDASDVPFSSITFKPRGQTDSDRRIWTGDLLIDKQRLDVQRLVLHAVDVPKASTNFKAPTESLLGDDVTDMGLEETADPDEPETVKETYLFIEAGGFSGSLPKTWTSPYYVLKRAD